VTIATTDGGGGTFAQVFVQKNNKNTIPTTSYQIRMQNSTIDGSQIPKTDDGPTPTDFGDGCWHMFAG
jgi:hypothetical protein